MHEPNQIEFPDKIEIDFIKENNITGIAYQDVRRFPNSKTINNSTAFFINKNFLLTSAHNITKLPFHSVRKISIYPSRIGDEWHHGSLSFRVNYNSQIRYPDKYNYYQSATHKENDLALIYLTDRLLTINERIAKISSLPIYRDMQKIKEGDTIYCAGYPAEGKYSKQFIMTLDKSVIKKKHDNYFEHSLETLTGNSGSPIMIKEGEQFYVIGINSIKHYGTFLNEEKQDLINKWMMELG